MMRYLFLAVLGIFVGGIVHVVSLMAIPVLAPHDAYTRLESVGPRNAFTPLPPATQQGDVAPFFDPAFVYRVCRYNLREGALRISVPVGSSYLVVAFHARDSVAYYALNERSAVGGTIDVVMHAAGTEPPVVNARSGAPASLVASPTEQGLVLIRALVPSPSYRADVEATLDRAKCVPLNGGS